MLVLLNCKPSRHSAQHATVTVTDAQEDDNHVRNAFNIHGNDGRGAHTPVEFYSRLQLPNALPSLIETNGLGSLALTFRTFDNL